MSNALTTAQIINAVADANAFERKKSQETVNWLLELTKRSLESGDVDLWVRQIRGEKKGPKKRQEPDYRRRYDS